MNLAKSAKVTQNTQEMSNEELNKLSNKIIGIAIKVHKQLGPGFIEKIYEKAFAYELKKAKMNFSQQQLIKVNYEGTELSEQRVDFIIENEIIIEIKSVSQIIDLHKKQIISYLKTSDKKLGLILNFGKMKLEIKRLVNNF